MRPRDSYVVALIIYSRRPRYVYRFVSYFAKNLKRFYEVSRVNPRRPCSSASFMSRARARRHCTAARRRCGPFLFYDRNNKTRFYTKLFIILSARSTPYAYRTVTLILYHTIVWMIDNINKKKKKKYEGRKWKKNKDGIYSAHGWTWTARRKAAG